MEAIATQDRITSKAERLRILEQTLIGAGDKGVRPSEIARRLGVRRQTVYRDLRALSNAHVPLWNPGRGRWAVLQDQYVGTVRLTIHEAVALFFAARLLVRMADEFNPHAVSALEKLSLRFPEPVRTQARQAARQMEGSPRNREFVQALESLTLGWIERRKVRVLYRSAEGRAAHPYVLHPYFLEPIAPGLAAYVLGYEETYFRSIVTLKIERMTGARLLDERFEEPANFDPAAVLQNAWGIMGSPDPVTVRLRFTPDVTRRVKESHWHPSQHIEDTPDGGCILTLRVGHTLELVPWIRSWGRSCEVLEPAPLREQLGAEYRAAAALYHAG
ncbi:WYL domain-containing protein [Carboxydochorda subterranea]|uniref:WYL domain-containing protein n=1 Tax=Carboxydichorda subterranea TaxID=3109565 RepID=A0ABZ1BW07_9FIRM|nr:WYL domain-containing protein [Limnochorda sp. L945t]WRP16859.1 WYL domain-containing protein [Limnochorda sp. L945t]